MFPRFFVGFFDYDLSRLGVGLTSGTGFVVVVVIRKRKS